MDVAQSSCEGPGVLGVVGSGREREDREVAWLGS